MSAPPNFKAELSALCAAMDAASERHTVVMLRTKQEAAQSRRTWTNANTQFRIDIAALERREFLASRATPSV